MGRRRGRWRRRSRSMRRRKTPYPRARPLASTSSSPSSASAGPAGRGRRPRGMEDDDGGEEEEEDRAEVEEAEDDDDEVSEIRGSSNCRWLCFGIGPQAAYENLVSTIKMIAVDCASDEINSVRDMRDPSDGQPPLAPNLELIGRDKAHGSRRGITRPWKADDDLNWHLETFVSGNRSIVQKIDRSLDLRRMFTKHCSELESGFLANRKLLVSLRSAKHRFESLASPLGTFVVWLHAYIMTAREVIVMRTGVEVQCIVEFLHNIDTRKCVMMAMMADAADDALCFTRGVDSWDNFDPSKINGDVYCFLVRIVELYVKGKVCTTMSYTQYMLESLRLKPVVVPVGQNNFKTIGNRDGIPQDIIRDCLQKMSCWVKLCVHVMRAEFPDFELIQRFTVFDLDAGASSARQGGGQIGMN